MPKRTEKDAWTLLRESITAVKALGEEPWSIVWTSYHADAKAYIGRKGEPDPVLRRLHDSINVARQRNQALVAGRTPTNAQTD